MAPCRVEEINVSGARDKLLVESVSEWCTVTLNGQFDGCRSLSRHPALSGSVFTPGADFLSI